MVSTEVADSLTKLVPGGTSHRDIKLPMPPQKCFERDFFLIGRPDDDIRTSTAGNHKRPVL